METDEKLYELLSNVTTESYQRSSFSKHLQTVCELANAELVHSDQALVDYEIRPGHRQRKTGVILEMEHTAPPYIDNRSPYNSITFLQELIDQEGYAALVSMGPNSIVVATSGEGHEYFTTELEEDLTGYAHLSYLRLEDCAEILTQFFKAVPRTGSIESEQQSFDDF